MKGLKTLLFVSLLIAVCLMIPIEKIKALDPWTRFSDATLTSSEDEILGMVSYKDNLYTVGNGDFDARVWKYDGTNWIQVNIDGFGDTNNTSAQGITTYNDNLYVGTWNITTGGEIWQYDGNTWSQINVDGFGKITNRGITSLEVYDGSLYAGTENNSGLANTDGTMTWRYDGGTTWTPIYTGAFGDANNNAIYAMENHDGKLYIGVTNGTTGVEVWTWDGSNVVNVTNGNEGFGDFHNESTYDLLSHDGELYASVEESNVESRIYRYDGGTAWTQINTNGFGNSNNYGVYGMESYNGKLYASVHYNNVTGTEIWEYDGSNWTQVNEDGFGLTNERIGNVFAVHDGYIFASSAESIEGATDAKVWRAYSEPIPTPTPTPDPKNPENNLAITILCPNEVTINEEIKCEIKNKNKGDEEVDKVKVTIRVPEEVEYVKTYGTTSAWNCDYSKNSRKVRCKRNNFSAGKTSKLYLKFITPSIPQEFSIPATIEYNGPETTYSDNKDSDKIRLSYYRLPELPATGKSSTSKLSLFANYISSLFSF